MAFDIAKKLFKQAQQIATNQDDAYRETIAAGLIELASALQTHIQKIENELSAIKSKVS